MNDSKIFPVKLERGDLISIIAPSRSLAILSDETKSIANHNLKQLGLRLTFGQHVAESDSFHSSSIESRVHDLHEAFANKEVKAILTVIGGYNCNQLLRYLDWELIRKNPKIVCGYSDITALSNAIYAKTGLVTYSGPHYSTFGQKLHLEYTVDYFTRCLMQSEVLKVKPSPQWTDDAWYLNQYERKPIDNHGYLVINNGEAAGTIVGGNLCTLNLLQGTEYMPSLDESILFIEDDYESAPHTFDRDLQSLIHQPSFKGVKAMVIGRFQQNSKMNTHLLREIIRTKKELAEIPVIADVDFGHTNPMITFPVGGTCNISARDNYVAITLVEH